MSTELVQDKAWQARDLILSVLKALKTRKLFQGDHPNVEKVVKEVQQRFKDFFEKYENLKLQVTPEEFRTENVEVYRDHNRDESLAFKFYVDGIRELTLKRDLTDEEVGVLLDILAVNTHDESSEDDLVTLLWKQSFKGLDYFVVDELYDYTAEAFDEESEVKDKMEAMSENVRDVVDSLNEGSFRHVMTDAYKEFEKLKDSPLVAGGNRAPGPATLTPEILGVSDKEIAELRLDFEREGGAELVDRAIEIIFEVVGRGTDLEPGELSATLSYFLSVKRELRDFPGLNRILEKIQEFTSGLGVLKSSKLLLDEIDALATEEKIRETAEVLNDRHFGSVEDVARYFKLLGPKALRHLAYHYPEIKGKEMRAAIRGLLSNIRPEDLDAMAAILGSSQSRNVRDGLSILTQIPHPRAAELIQVATRNADPDVREHAVWVLSRHAGLSSTDHLIPFLSDPSRSIRLSALRRIAQKKGLRSYETLKEILLDGRFLNRDAEEKTYFIESLAATGGDPALHFLSDLVNRGRWSPFKRLQRAELREIVTRVLDRIEAASGAAPVPGARGNEGPLAEPPPFLPNFNTPPPPPPASEPGFPAPYFGAPAPARESAEGEPPPPPAAEERAPAAPAPKPPIKKYKYN